MWLEKGEEPNSELAKSVYGDGVPTPAHVKRVLDETLLDARIDFLYGCYPTDVLRDDKGALAGVVMANRSGRQAVRAKAIEQVGENHERISKVLTDVPRALPLLKAAYGKATDADKKLRYAHVLPELVLARALYRCGDHKGLAKSILTEYAKDLRGHYATHAKAILAEGEK